MAARRAQSTISDIRKGLLNEIANLEIDTDDDRQSVLTASESVKKLLLFELMD